MPKGFNLSIRFTMVFKAGYEVKQAKRATLYDVLEVPTSATPEEIVAAYRRLVKRWHPDVCKEEGAEAKFKEVVAAYKILSDAGKRRKYDAAQKLLSARVEKETEVTYPSMPPRGYSSRTPSRSMQGLRPWPHPAPAPKPASTPAPTFGGVIQSGDYVNRWNINGQAVVTAIVHLNDPKEICLGCITSMDHYGDIRVEKNKTYPVGSTIGSTIGRVTKANYRRVSSMHYEADIEITFL